MSRNFQHICAHFHDTFEQNMLKFIHIFGEKKAHILTIFEVFGLNPFHPKKKGSNFDNKKYTYQKKKST